MQGIAETTIRTRLPPLEGKETRAQPDHNLLPTDAQRTVSVRLLFGLGLIANLARWFRAVEAGASPRPGRFGRTAGAPLRRAGWLGPWELRAAHSRGKLGGSSAGRAGPAVFIYRAGPAVFGYWAGGLAHATAAAASRSSPQGEAPVPSSSAPRLDQSDPTVPGRLAHRLQPSKISMDAS